MKQKIRVGTRSSTLAQIQTDIVVNKLRQITPSGEIEIIHITTSGDRCRTVPIADLGQRGVFVKELEEALLYDEVDLVVHSLKDLPNDLPDGLVLAAVLDRGDPRDVLISRDHIAFKDLPTGSRVATSSRRRAAQLKAIRNDLQFVDIRGNVPTRIQKLDNDHCDAMVLAAAGLLRLGLYERITEYFPLDIMVPAAGQAALAVECRQNDQEILQLLSTINQPKTMTEVTCERVVLDTLGGGCSVPIGALCTTNAEGKLVLSVCVAALDGSQLFKTTNTAPQEQYQELGILTAQQILEMGADKVLKSLRESAPNAISAP